ncbi:hypothetical protein ACFWVM_17505 [Nocardia fluminea]|uniref:hypothetical protein n=1 Tax=Nocardia fluminea TaxID=134984 RepID=UPI003656A989
MLHEPATEQGMRVMIERAAVEPKFAEVKEELYLLDDFLRIHSPKHPRQQGTS